MNKPMNVAVAMSGGVDSSVAASLISQSGVRTFGLMLRLWSSGPDRPNRCCSPSDVANARKVAGKLGIPFYVVDAKDEFHDRVVEGFARGYEAGLTPNPCLTCNREIRWGLLLEHALMLGASHLATGHYAQVHKANGQYQVLRAKDRDKDQSYVLSVLSQRELSRTLLPLGELTKAEVRQIARDQELASAERPESQDLCFLGGTDYREFLLERVTSAPGTILDTQGDQLGTHAGLINFTIGQRKGIGVSGSEPYYVIEKDTRRNALIVGSKNELGRTRFLIQDVNWIAGVVPEPDQQIKVQVRYRAPAVPAQLQPSGDTAEVTVDEPIHNVAPGQAAVFYQGDTCLGGGVIAA